VRAAAAEALDRPDSREVASALLDAAGDDVRLVRVRAAASLAGVPPQWVNEQQAEDLKAAIAEFGAAMRSRPDDHASHYNLGNFLMEWGQFEQAVECFQTASKLQPRDPAPFVNASLAYNALGRNEQAERSLREALKLDPTSAAANLNLGLLLAEMNRVPEAETTLRRALKADLKLASAAFNLGVILARDRLPEALHWCRIARELRPESAKYAYTLAFYEHQAGNADEAVSILRALLDAHPEHADSYGLLGEILEGQGKRTDAINLYRQAADSAALPEQVRAFFDAKREALEKP
jgi:tetratricopeptide (TPR) repeat protein